MQGRGTSSVDPTQTARRRLNATARVSEVRLLMEGRHRLGPVRRVVRLDTRGITRNLTEVRFEVRRADA